MPHRMLIVDDDNTTLQSLGGHFSGQGYRVDCARTLDDAWTFLANAEYSIVISELYLGDIMNAEGLDLMHTVREESPSARRILYTAAASADIEESAKRQGIDAVVAKPTPLPEMAAVVLDLMTQKPAHRVIRGFELREEIGVGGIGTIWLAHDRNRKQLVAVKELHPTLAKDEEFIGRFVREAEVAAKLQHENIVEVVDFGRDEGIYFLAMEYVDGCDLQIPIEAVDQVLLPVALTIGMDVLAGLQHAHDQGVIHRDIKPGNILLNGDGVAKIADFSIAKNTRMSVMTTSGTVFGTPPYMSPEQVNGLTLDHRTDLFSAGVVMYEMLAGRRPFDAATYPSTITKLLTYQPPDLSEVDPLIPESIARVVRRALEKDRSRRYASASEFRRDLHAVVEREDLLTGHSLVADFLREPARLQQDLKRGMSKRALQRGLELEAAGQVEPAIQQVGRATLWDPDNQDARAKLAELRSSAPQSADTTIPKRRVSPATTQPQPPARTPTPMPRQDPRRSDARVASAVLEATVEIGSEEAQPARMFVTDLSKQGAFLECAKPPAIGTQVRVLLPVTPSRVLSISARVAHVVTLRAASAEGTIPGMGVTFEGVTADVRRLVDEAVSKASTSKLPVAGAAVTEVVEATARPAAAPPPEEEPQTDEGMARRLLESARSAMEQKLYIKAANDLHLAQKCDPNNPEIHKLAAQAALAAAEAKAALLVRQGEYLRQAYLRELSKRPVAAARTLESMFRCFRDAATIAPHKPEYLKSAAETALELGAKDEAYEFVKRALEVVGDDAQLLALKAKIHQKRGDTSESVEAINQAHKLAPEDPEIALLRKQIRKNRWSRSIVGLMTDIAGGSDKDSTK